MVVPFLTLLGIGATVWFGFWKTNRELDASQDKWRIDRNDSLAKIETDRAHAADEARRARLVVARREVYLDLIKEMTAASMALGGMPFKKGESLEVEEGFKGFLSAVARVAILGEMDTVLKSRELMSLVQRILYKKLPEIGDLRFIKSQQERLESLERQQLEKSESIKNIVANLLSDSSGSLGPQKSTLLESWSQGLNKSDADAKLYGEGAADFGRQYVNLARGYQRSIVDDTIELAAKTNELIVCIREELELDSDLSSLESSTAEMFSAIKESIEKMQATYSD